MNIQVLFVDLLVLPKLRFIKQLACIRDSTNASAFSCHLVQHAFNIPQIITVPAMYQQLTVAKFLPVAKLISKLGPHPLFTQSLSSPTVDMCFSHLRVQILAT